MGCYESDFSLFFLILDTGAVCGKLYITINGGFIYLVLSYKPTFGMVVREKATLRVK